MVITHIAWRIVLFAVGLFVSANSYSAKNSGSAGVATAIVVGSVLETLIGSFLMLVAALGRLPW